MSAMLDSELWDCPGLLLHRRVFMLRSHAVSRRGLRLFGTRSLNVSRRNVVISCSTKQATIFRAYGQSMPESFTEAVVKRDIIMITLLIFFLNYEDCHLNGITAVCIPLVYRGFENILVFLQDSLHVAPELNMLLL